MWDNTSFDRKKEIAGAVEKLKEIKGLGVTSFVDPCPMELGRDPEFAAESSTISSRLAWHPIKTERKERGKEALIHVLSAKQ